MRLALVGKGGSGKSVIAGTIARLLARKRRSVLALDIDTLPGLAFSIGLGPTPDNGLPEDLAERREGSGWVLRAEISAETLVDRYALPAPDGIRFLQLGKLPRHVRPGSVVAFRHVVESFRKDGWSIIGDLAAGTRQGFGGWAGFASLIGIVLEPTHAAVVSARRLSRLAETVPGAKLGIILNKVTGREAQRPWESLDLPLWAALPFDADVAAAERLGVAPVDHTPDSEAVSAIAELLASLRCEELS